MSVASGEDRIETARVEVVDHVGVRALVESLCDLIENGVRKRVRVRVGVDDEHSHEPQPRRRPRRAHPHTADNPLRSGPGRRTGAHCRSSDSVVDSGRPRALPPDVLKAVGEEDGQAIRD